MGLAQVYICYITVIVSDSFISLNNNLCVGADNAPFIFGVDDGKNLPQLSEFLFSEFKRHSNCVLWYNQKQKVQKAVDKTVNNVAAENSIYVSFI